MSRFSRRSRSSFFFSVEIFKIETFASRFGYVEIFIKIVKINRDCQDFRDSSRLFEIYRDILTLLRLFEGVQAKKSWQIEKSRSRKVVKSANYWSRSRKNWDFWKISIETFWIGRWPRDKIKISQSQPRLLDHRDKLFEVVEIFSTVKIGFFSCRDWDSWSRHDIDKLRPPGLHIIHS